MPEFSEWGYFDVGELQTNNAEKDKFFEPTKFKKLHQQSIAFLFFYKIVKAVRVPSCL